MRQQKFSIIDKFFYHNQLYFGKKCESFANRSQMLDKRMRIIHTPFTNVSHQYALHTSADLTTHRCIV